MPTPSFAVPSSGYDLRSGGVWRMQIPWGTERHVSIKNLGGMMSVRSNNPSVVPQDRLSMFTDFDGSTLLTIFAKVPGTSMIEVVENGAVVASLQVQCTGSSGRVGPPPSMRNIP